MKANGLLIRSVFFALLPSFSYAGVSARTAQIFRKDNRELEPPPKTLKANSESSDIRYKAGSERLSRKVDNYDDDDAAASASASASIDVEDRYEQRPVKRASSARGISTSRRRENGFSGERYFGLGFVGGGAYGVFGGEVDFGLSEDWTAGFGVGTGMSYSSWAMHARYFMRESHWSPLVEGGYAQWTLGKVPQGNDGIVPKHLSQRFFENQHGWIESSKTVHIVYPGIGVLYQNKSGLAALFELQYFIKANDFTGALFGTTGVFFYF